MLDLLLCRETGLQLLQGALAYVFKLESFHTVSMNERCTLWCGVMMVSVIEDE